MPSCILWYTMSYAVVTTKVDPRTKKEAMETAQALGVPLSVVIKAFLKQFIRTKSVTFNAGEEVPNEYLRSVIKEAETNLKSGRHSPVFKTGEDAVAWLEKQGV
mgnify:CR=1 FL=1